MKVLTLHEPWASLVALEIKTCETRSWKAPDALIGQRIALHAAAKKPTADQRVGDWTVHEMAGGSWAMTVDDDDARSCADDSAALPLGCIVATARLDACLPITGPNDAGYDEFICPNIYDQFDLAPFRTRWQPSAHDRGRHHRPVALRRLVRYRSRAVRGSPRRGSRRDGLSAGIRGGIRCT